MRFKLKFSKPDQEDFLLFDAKCPQTGARAVGFASKLSLEVLEMSSILLSDGTFAVGTDPFKQLWTMHAKFDDSTVPVVHVLMTSRSIADYVFVLKKVKMLVPSWNPTDYLGDLEIGQARAVSTVFPRVKTSYCYFHLKQSWFRCIKNFGLDDLCKHGGSIYQFWSLLRCLPYADVSEVETDFDTLVTLLPTPITNEMQKFVDYIKKYVVTRQNLMFPAATWNVSSRTIRSLPRTTNSAEALHRNLERCINVTRGRAAPLLSELLRCLRQEASKLKFDKKALDIDPTYEVSAQRKQKDVAKDARILAVYKRTTITGNTLKGLDFMKAMRAAKKYI